METVSSNEADPEFLALPAAWRRILANVAEWRREVGRHHLTEILEEHTSPRAAVVDDDVVDVFGASLGRVIRHRRIRRGLPVRLLASTAGMDTATLSRIERGRRSARVDQLVAIAGALGCSVVDLVEGADGTECAHCSARRVEHMRLCPRGDPIRIVARDAFG
jgi:DNA-binding Xre family transcriptional regulator